MICLICRQGETVDGVTPVMFEHGEFKLIVNNVPARVCPCCGEAYVQQAIANQLLNFARQQYASGIVDTQSEYDAL